LRGADFGNDRAFMNDVLHQLEGNKAATVLHLSYEKKVYPAWGIKLADRIGMKKARAIAVILHCIWVDTSNARRNSPS
jgi:hypothetical protein